MMAPVVPLLRKTLERAVVRDPLIPVVLSTTGRAAKTAADLVEGLARALVLPVRWPAAVRALRALGAPAAYDAGPGDTLRRLARFTPDVSFRALP
jgi:malonyl CoA-acyl carrier protein transacylase